MEKVTIKIAEKFRPLLTEHFRYKLYYGGRAGGKSYAFADCLLLLARQKKLFIACVREVQNSIKDSVYKLLKDRAEYYKFDDFIFYEDRIENIVTGSKFVFKGLKDQNKQNIKSLEGVDICWCFVAGTKIDGRNVEDIRVGDYVWSYNLEKKIFEYKKVKRIMRKKSPDELIRLTLSGLPDIIGTANHPILVKDKGYIPLGEIKEGDIIYAKEDRSSRICLLFGRLWRKNLFRFCWKKSKIQKDWETLLFRLCQKNKFGKNEKTKSYGQSSNFGKNEKNNNQKRDKTEDFRGKWERLLKSSRVVMENSWSWLVGGIIYTNRTLQRQRGFTDELQSRPCEYILRDCNRSGWWNSLWSYCEGRRQEKSSILREQRVDSIKIQKQGSLKQFGLSDGGNYVYNIEVEGNNNYFANGILVHNCEESQAITKESFEVLDPTIRKSGSELWFSMNRENENDAIWRAIAANPDDQTLIVKVNYYDNPFCPDEMKYLAEKCKAENLDDYMHIWEGEPISLGDYKLFNVKDVREAMIPKMDSSTSPLIIGLDIARAGSDKTVFCLRKGRWVMKFDVIKGYDTVEVADKLTNYIKELHPAKAFLDLGNSGAGVYDIMKARGFAGIVKGVNFGGKAIQPDRYKNKRAEMYATANEWIKQELPVQLPNDDLLFEELTTIERVKVAGDTLQLEDKELFKKRIGRSPDRADAFVLTFAEPVYDNGTVKTYGNYTTINDLFFGKKRSNNTW